jgi:hypothetical protein
VSGSTVVASAPDSRQAGAYVFVQPAGGWAGALHEAATLAPYGGEIQVAISGATLATALLEPGPEHTVRASATSTRSRDPEVAGRA